MTPEQFEAAKTVMVQGPMLLVIVALSIIFIIYATAKLKIHPFLALLFSAYIVGFLTRMPIQYIGNIISQGFGGIMTNIGLVIVFGTIIGTIMERSGAAIKMAEVVLNIVGIKRSPLAMNIIGYIVSIPVFCDSGYVILTPLNKALSKRSEIPMATMAIALSTGLYATHTLVPPTPGPIAAAGNIGADLGLVILIGLVISIPTALVGLWWAFKAGKNIESEMDKTALDYEELKKQFDKLPSAGRAFAPIVVPIILIALASIVKFKNYTGGVGNFILFLGAPVNALIIGVLLAMSLMPKFDEETLTDWIGKGLLDAANILLITGAGGSLGTIISNTPIADFIKTLAGGNIAGGPFILLLPFAISALLKTAQGSSTVALVTTSSLIAPLLAEMGLVSPMDLALTVMAIGAGAITVSHVNDSYFWVVTQFSGLSVTNAYKAQTIGTLLEGLVSIIIAIIFFAIFH